MYHPPINEGLTNTDIMGIAAALYEPRARVWLTATSWLCPQCRRANGKHIVQCHCGISRDGLPEFCERARAYRSAAIDRLPLWAQEEMREQESEVSPVLEGAVLVFVPCFLFWAGLIAAAATYLQH